MAAVVGVIASSAAPAAARVNTHDPRVREIRRVLQRVYEGVADPSDDDRSNAWIGIAFVDLNGDGVDEAIVFGPVSRDWCGTGGCEIAVYEQRGRRWTLKCSTGVSHDPIGILTTRHFGWRDLAVLVAGGGIVPGYRAVLSYNGKCYPQNASGPPARPMGRGDREAVLIREQDLVRLFPGAASVPP